jgi:hypothetical protein
LAIKRAVATTFPVNFLTDLDEEPNITECYIYICIQSNPPTYTLRWRQRVPLKRRKNRGQPFRVTIQEQNWHQYLEILIFPHYNAVKKCMLASLIIY